MMCFDCVEVVVYATAPLCTENHSSPLLEMHVAVPKPCAVAPACLSASYARNKTQACFVNERCTTFELERSHNSRTEVTDELGYGVIMAISAPFFLCVFLFSLRNLLEERREAKQSNMAQEARKKDIHNGEEIVLL